MKKNKYYQAPSLEMLNLINSSVLCASDVEASVTNESFTVGDEIDFD